MLICESSKKGYDRLLQVFDKTTRPIDGHELSTCRRILATGGSAADINWLAKEDLFAEWNSKDFAPTALRELTTTLAEWGVWFDTDEMSTLCDSIRSHRDLAPYASAVSWLTMFPKCGLEEGTVRHFKSMFLTAATAVSLCQQLRSFFPMWVVPPKIHGTLELESADLELNRWLRQLAWYQRLAGRRPALPKAVRRAEAAARCTAQELEWMQHERRTGAWSDSLERRYRNLMSRDGAATELQSAKLVRTAARAASVAGVQVLEQKLDEFSTLWWRSRFDDIGEDLRHRDRVEIGGWIGRLDRHEIALFDEILSLWKSDGSDFKRKLSFNKNWIQRAEATEFDISAWFQPRRWMTNLDSGGEIEISTEPDPFQVFLMGTHFQTCLSLRTGCNHLAVLANASHTNKAVLYVRDASRKIVGRKLLAISRGGGLLGYHTYCHWNHGKARRMLLDAVGRFCGSWARDMRIPLANEGESQELGNHFWYDDDPEDWSSVARWSWHFPARILPVRDRSWCAAPNQPQSGASRRQASLLV